MVGEIYARFLIDRAVESTEMEIGEKQCGLRKDSSCADVVFAVRHRCEKIKSIRTKATER